MIRSALLVLALFAGLLMVSCDRKASDAQAGMISADSLIQPEKMALLLSDIHLAEAAFLIERNAGMTPRNVEGFYNGIFAKHHVSRKRYERSLEWYRQNPDEYQDVYTEVARLLEERQKRLNAGK